ncbi:MAG: protoheme IX farnesyltransferase [Bacteroidales bacterium]|nr:protoheme IX farnesyltransferase [Bacteroidales bacterium]
MAFPSPNTFLELAKVKITFAVSLTTVTGYLLAKNAFDSGIILPVSGIFLLACGSSAINHLQERKRDALMNRTQGRPLPSGKITPFAATLFAVILVSGGSLLLWTGSGLTATLLGLLALAWYNLVYTPLKTRTAFAVVPGSLIGAIPPLVGWVAGGGSLSDPRAMILAFFFFIWQVPHFWLLLLKYSREYERAGMPSLTGSFSITQIKKMTFIWTLSTAVSALMLPASGIIRSMTFSVAVAVASIWLVAAFSGLILKKGGQFDPFRYFMKINFFVLLIIVFLSLDAVL